MKLVLGLAAAASLLVTPMLALADTGTGGTETTYSNNGQCQSALVHARNDARAAGTYTNQNYPFKCEQIQSGQNAGRYHIVSTSITQGV